MQLIKLSKHVPQPGSDPLEPKWMEQFKAKTNMEGQLD